MKEINYEQFEIFADKLGQHHFFHSKSWADAREQMGWECEYLGLYDENKLIATCVVHLKKLPKIGYKMLYIPKGMVIDYENQEHLEKFSEAIKKYAKSKKAYVVKIDPEYKRYEIDLEGNPLSEETEVIRYLKQVGFKHLGYLDNFEGINYRHSFILHYANRSEEELFKLMKSNDRSKIKKSKELGVYLEYGTKVDLDDFMDVMEITASRGGYQIRSREFFEIILDSFNEDNLKLVFSKINIQDYLQILNDNIDNLQKQLLDVQGELSQEELSNKQKKKLINQEKEFKKQIDKFESDKTYANEMKQKYQKDIICLSTSLYVYYKGRVYYWYSGSNSDFRNLRAVKVQMWDIIDDSVKEGYDSLDFMGTSGILDLKDKNYGLYEFKKSFGGDWEEYIGEFDIVINPIIYKVAGNIIPKLQTSQNSFLIKTLKKIIK